MNQQHVGAGLRIGRAALQRFIEAEIGDQRLGAGNDDQVMRLARLARRLDLALELLDPYQLLPSAAVG